MEVLSSKHTAQEYHNHEASFESKLQSLALGGTATPPHSFAVTASSGCTTPSDSSDGYTKPSSEASEEYGPFEGPEKLLEIWWQDCSANVPNGKGLRMVKRHDWEAMLDLVHCKVLSVIQGNGVDAYMLSESSMFIWPHKLILKTCGTTTLLLGLKTILQLAIQAGFVNGAWRVFYSRKSFMFPDRQKGPHRDWKDEMSVLDRHFVGSGYTVGPMNGDHWLLYMNQPNDAVLDYSAVKHVHSRIMHDHYTFPPDQSMELLMTEMDPSACQQFYYNADNQHLDGHAAGRQLSQKLGISSLFPSTERDGKAQLDAYLFEPCGYSANIIAQHDRYATIHVTPEVDWSYASFETNVVFGTGLPGEERLGVQDMVDRVLSIFKPRKWSLTLFVSREEDEPETTGEQGLALLHKGSFPRGYRRTDKICYEFADYDLLFSTFKAVVDTR